MEKGTKEKIKILIVILMASIAVLAAVIILFGFDIKIKVYGDEIITLQYGESYEEPGVDAVWYNSILGTKSNIDVAIEKTIKYTVADKYCNK